MSRLKFTKMVGAGNDFVVIDTRLSVIGVRLSLPKLACALCERKTGVGADGALVLEKSKKADFKMRIFNADGSEAEMCGNGLRCAVLHAGKKRKVKIETMAGMYEAEITGKNRVRIKMAGPKDLKKDLCIIVNGRAIKVNYIDTGVPHAVIFVEGLDKIDVDNIGRGIRYHDEFKPRGTNVDFVEIIDDTSIRMRTYERGVEGETLACGTGAVASAIISVIGYRLSVIGINVHTKGGILKVYFKKDGSKVKDVYLEGEAKIVYKGEVDYV
ncbi:MAG: diaminopimelate epimerase [Candidatus Omnitrophica bacterium]|nr:diaminopimelate epimerase [Candidatus Omnitrophota bacterium]